LNLDNREIDVTETSFYIAFSTFNLLLLLTTSIVLSNLYAKACQLTQSTRVLTELADQMARIDRHSASEVALIAREYHPISEDCASSMAVARLKIRSECGNCIPWTRTTMVLRPIVFSAKRRAPTRPDRAKPRSGHGRARTCSEDQSSTSFLLGDLAIKNAGMR
jgi:hypothetical protein